MSYKLTIAKAAENDIRQAFLWYQEQKVSLGKTFEKHIFKAVNSIQDNPLKIQTRYNNTRIFFLKKLPFGIHFKVNGKEVFIIAVFHTSQRSENWKDR